MNKGDKLFQLFVGFDMPFAHLPWRAVPGTNAQDYSTNGILLNFLSSLLFPHL
jgi:hypothetical protein